MFKIFCHFDFDFDCPSFRHSQESKQWWDARRFLTFENKVVCHKNVHFAGNVGGKWEVVDWWLVINYRSAASDKLTRILLSEALGYKHSPHLHKMKNTYLVKKILNWMLVKKQCLRLWWIIMQYQRNNRIYSTAIKARGMNNINQLQQNTLFLLINIIIFESI